MIYLHIFVSENKKMLKKPTQKEIDNWNRIRANGVKKYQENKKKKPVVKKKSPVLKPISKKSVPIKKKSKAQIKRDAKYLKAKKEYLEELDDPMCQMRLSPECIENHQVATEVHHQKGKIGDLYWDKRFFKSGCRYCHDYELGHDAEAKEKGVTLYRNRIN